jgi:peptidoglycan/LPS O-acetylase OafA/YrhL
MPQSRRYDIDWLRVCATYLLFVFHVGKVFDVAPFYHIKNAELSPGLNYLTGFIHQWHMPLFFLLAGWSAFGSLSTRGPSAFLRERLRRLLLPFVAGCVLLCPLIKYIELKAGMGMTHTGGITHAPFNETFLTFLPTFFTRLDRFTWAHLWFLIYLFTFTLLYLPLFSWLVRRTATRTEAKAEAGAVMVVYLPIIPLALIQVTLRGYWPGFQNLFDDWANFSYYSLYFIFGFLMARNPAFERAVQHEYRRAGLIGLVAVLLMIPTDSVATVYLNRALSAVAGWCFVVAFLGGAWRFLGFSNAALRYLSESAFPIYILHQVGIVLVGYFVIQLSAGIAVKYAVLLVGSVVATMAAYHYVVRPLPPLRLLYGMKPRVVQQPLLSGTGAALNESGR